MFYQTGLMGFAYNNFLTFEGKNIRRNHTDMTATSKWLQTNSEKLNVFLTEFHNKQSRDIGNSFDINFRQVFKTFQEEIFIMKPLLETFLSCIDGDLLKTGKFLFSKKAKATFAEAESFCTKLGLQLPMPDSIAENDELGFLNQDC